MLRLPNDGTSERQYLGLIQDCLEDGDYYMDRTGTGVLSVHGRSMRFNLSDGTWPLLTTKRVRWKSSSTEMIGFLQGQTNVRWYLERNCTIWSEWPHKKYVEATGDHITVSEFEQRILSDAAFAEQYGSCGRFYGAQWRRWLGPDGKQYDQLSTMLDNMRKDKHSRRHLFHAWNPAELDLMALPPCHVLYMWQITSKDKLNLTLAARSQDVGLGIPFNVCSAALLVHMIAQQLGLVPGDLFWVGHDVHVYSNHVEGLKEQLTRTPTPFPKIKFNRKPDSLFDYTINDFEPVGYKPQKAIPLPVAV